MSEPRREELATIIERGSKEFPLGTDLHAGCLGLADVVLAWRRLRRDGEGTICDLCEEVTAEWEWVDAGWSLACKDCLDKIRSPLRAETARLAQERDELAAKSDAEMLRVKACEHIAEGDEGWEALRNECPSTTAVARLRDERNLFQQENHRLLGRVLDLEQVRRLRWGVFITAATVKEPVALFEFADQAREWAERTYRGRAEIRERVDLCG